MNMAQKQDNALRAYQDWFTGVAAVGAARMTRRSSRPAKHRAYLEVYENLMQLRVDQASLKQKTVSKRGEITEYSDKSRNRFLRALNQLHWPQGGVYFITLTYPDVYQDDPDQVHQDLQKLYERMQYYFPSVALIWRLEWRRRKMGNNAGRVAPHFHALVFNWPAYVADNSHDLWSLWDWLRVNWAEIVYASTGADPDVMMPNGYTAYQNALIFGTDVKLVESRRQANYYVSKYMNKSEVSLPDLQTGEIQVPRGRAWGVKGRKRLDFSPLMAVALTHLQLIAFKLIVLSFLEESKAKFLDKFREYTSWMGFTLYVDALRFAQYFLDHRHENYPLAFGRGYS